MTAHVQVPISSQDLVLMSYEQLRRELAGRDCPLLNFRSWISALLWPADGPQTAGEGQGNLHARTCRLHGLVSLTRQEPACWQAPLLRQMQVLILPTHPLGATVICICHDRGVVNHARIRCYAGEFLETP
eukprot:1158969-Pelagomonas_calceolata.AAC.7